MTTERDINQEDEIDVSHLQRWSIEDVRRVRDNQQAEVIDGTLCDLFSTGAVIAVFETLKPSYQRKAQTMSFAAFGSFAWKCVNHDN